MSEKIDSDDSKDSSEDKKKKSRPAFEADDKKPNLMTHKPDRAPVSPVMPQSAEVEAYQAKMQAEAARKSIDSFLKTKEEDDDEEDDETKNKKEKTVEPAAQEPEPQEPAQQIEKTTTKQASDDKKAESAPEEPTQEATAEVAPQSGSEPTSETDVATGEKQSAANTTESEPQESSDQAVEDYVREAESSSDPEKAETNIIEKYDLEEVEKSTDVLVEQDPELKQAIETKVDELDILPEDKADLERIGEEILAELEEDSVKAEVPDAEPVSEPAPSVSIRTPESDDSDTTATTATTPSTPPVTAAPPTPPISGGGGGSGGSSGPLTPEGVPPSAELGGAISERKKSRRKTMSAALLGGLVGYYFGNKAGRRKQKAEMLPAQKELTKDNESLKARINDGQKRIRALRVIQAEQSKTAQTEAVPALAEKVQPAANPEVASTSSAQTSELAAAQAAVLAGVGVATAGSGEKMSTSSVPVDAKKPELATETDETSNPEASSDKPKAEARSASVEVSNATRVQTPELAEAQAAVLAGVGAAVVGSGEKEPNSSAPEAAKSAEPAPKTDETTNLEASSDKPKEESFAESIDPFGLKKAEAEKVQSSKPETAPPAGIDSFYQTAGAGKFEKPGEAKASPEAGLSDGPEAASSAINDAEVLELAKDTKVSGENLKDLLDKKEIDQAGLRRVIEAVKNDGAPELVLAQERHKLEAKKAESPEIQKAGQQTAAANSGVSGAASGHTSSKDDGPPTDLPTVQDKEDETPETEENTIKSSYAPKDYSKRNKILAGAVLASLLALLLV